MELSATDCVQISRSLNNIIDLVLTDYVNKTEDLALSFGLPIDDLNLAAFDLLLLNVIRVKEEIISSPKANENS